MDIKATNWNLKGRLNNRRFISFKSSILNQMNQRQSGRVFNFFQHKTRLRILHAVVRKQRIQKQKWENAFISVKKAWSR